MMLTEILGEAGKKKIPPVGSRNDQVAAQI
jgi:argininosuccinate lyase